MEPSVSVVIRSKDEGESIGRTLDLLAKQTREHEVVLVDSGSTDATVEIARGRGVEVIEIPAKSFTYGGALNTGCAAASGEVLVALSAHAFPTESDWLERIVAVLNDEKVACVCGQQYGPDGRVLSEPIRQDAELARRRPDWGYSNAAGAFPRRLWEEYEFRPDLPATEDKEWARHWLEKGYLCVLGPQYLVEHDHSKDGLLEQYKRARREWRGLVLMGAVEPYPARQMVHEWWTDQDSYRSKSRARLSHRRAARLLGRWVGLRKA
jgi:rhamnosyltransferase